MYLYKIEILLQKNINNQRQGTRYKVQDKQQ